MFGPGFGWPEALIILAVVLLIFGVGKVADVGPALGKAIRGFKKEIKGEGEPTGTGETAPREKKE